MSERLPVAAIERISGHVERHWLERMQVVTRPPGSWIPVVLGAGATTIGRRVFFRIGRYDTETPRGLALIAHEAMHIRQYAEYGIVGFLARYLWGYVSCGFRYRQHPMEAPLFDEQRRIRAALSGEGRNV
jgi:hypothetical protein